MTAEAYLFRTLDATDLPLIRTWLAEPHVREWWGDPDEQFGLIARDRLDPRVDMLLMLLGERPVGYVQGWAPHDWPGHPFHDQPAGTRGIDPFLGERSVLGQGHGGWFVRLLAERYLRAGAARIMIDPDPANRRAVRAYLRAGFQAVEVRQTDDGPALLMIRDPADTISSR